ncbi:MAG: spondin domain-containing protein [Thiohalocapsa sp.]
MRLTLPVAVTTGMMALLLMSAAHADNRRGGATKEYTLTITNLTKGQVFSPPVLVTHSEDVALFTLGEPALAELATVAEDGAGQPLADLASTLPQVAETQATSAALPPGETAEYQISSKRGFGVLSVVGMLVNTNDAFFAIDSARLPRYRRTSVMYYALGYDAGSEENNEGCAYVPGPACRPESGNDRAIEKAEGFVHVHNGVHGIAGLGTAAYDWRNPVALIKVERTR